MTLTSSLGLDASSKRAKILSKNEPEDFAWSIPFMRAGYAGRGTVYLVVAGTSLWSIFQGRDAKGTSEVFSQLNGPIGTTILALIALGMAAYAVWRVVDSVWDLEAYGRGMKGVVARLGMLVTGAAHLGIGTIALLAIWGGGSGGGSSPLSEIFQSEMGRLAIGLAALATIGAGLFYVRKGVKEEYRDHLRANSATVRANALLKLGVIAQGVSVALIGLMLVLGTLTADPSQAGGLGKAFDWLYAQAYGRVLVGLLCFGLLGFSFFCFVNACCRIIPRAAGDDTISIAEKLRQHMA